MRSDLGIISAVMGFATAVVWGGTVGDRAKGLSFVHTVTKNLYTLFRSFEWGSKH